MTNANSPLYGGASCDAIQPAIHVCIAADGKKIARSFLPWPIVTPFSKHVCPRKDDHIGDGVSIADQIRALLPGMVAISSKVSVTRKMSVKDAAKALHLRGRECVRMRMWRMRRRE